MTFKTKPTKQARWYLLRTSNKKLEEISLSLFGGLSKQEKSFSSIKEEGEKALRAGYNRILLSWNFVFHSEKEKLLKWIVANPQFFALSVHKKSFEDFKKMFEQHKSKQLLIDLSLEDNENKILEELENSKWFFQITILAHKGVRLKYLTDSLSKRYKNFNQNKTLHETKKQNLLKKILQKLNIKFKTHTQFTLFNQKLIYNKTVKPSLYIHFPYDSKKNPKLYKSKEMYDFLKTDFYFPPQIDIYNLSIPEDLELEPERSVEFSYSIPNSRPLASVIIPSYNCIEELCITLKHLFHQDLPKNQWEVIVVDDGSDDNTKQILKNLDFLSSINFKFIFLPRKYKREGFADHRFRAGIARNLGFKQAQGAFLFFLDSDILTPSFYLSSACKKLETEDVIQHPRYHLIESAPQEYNKIDKNKHAFIKDSGYWENFYAKAQRWNKKRLPWKYISTNTLCLKSSVFKQVGCFRKNYTCYGFEDTDLGYRLYQSGFRFQLNPVKTYHLYRPSEFFNSNELKQKLLKLSADIFFHNTHNLEAYEEFRHLIEKSNGFVENNKKI